MARAHSQEVKRGNELQKQLAAASRKDADHEENLDLEAAKREHAAEREKWAKERAVMARQLSAEAKRGNDLERQLALATSRKGGDAEELSWVDVPRVGGVALDDAEGSECPAPSAVGRKGGRTGEVKNGGDVVGGDPSLAKGALEAPQSRAGIGGRGGGQLVEANLLDPGLLLADPSAEASSLRHGLREAAGQAWPPSAHGPSAALRWQRPPGGWPRA